MTRTDDGSDARRRRARVAWVGVPLIAASAVVVAIATGALSFGGGQADDPAVAPFDPVASAEPLPEPSTYPDAITGTGELPDPYAAIKDCVGWYSLETLRDDVDLAFDGTITGFGPAISNRGPDVAGDLELVGVTFAVHEWFAGGSQATVTVDLTPPDGDIWPDNIATPIYGEGTRLLVSGAARWGGEPPEDAIAWQGCGGFTRYYDDASAVGWRSAFG